VSQDLYDSIVDDLITEEEMNGLPPWVGDHKRSKLKYHAGNKKFSNLINPVGGRIWLTLGISGLITLGASLGFLNRYAPSYSVIGILITLAVIQGINAIFTIWTATNLTLDGWATRPERVVAYILAGVASIVCIVMTVCIIIACILATASEGVQQAVG
jgi:hypothetical protein